MTPRRAQHAHMTRLLKRRGNEKKPTNDKQAFDWRWLMSVCMPAESPRSSILQRAASRCEQ